MYQYYYSNEHNEKLNTKYMVADKFNVEKVRVTMWEEHCLECSAPLCYEACLNYERRQDGRCRLFKDSIAQYESTDALLGKCARVKFRKWGNLLSIVFPRMVTLDEYKKIDAWADKTSQKLLKKVNGKSSVSNKWKYIRVKEFLRRRKLKQGTNDSSDAFILHCFNHKDEAFTLFLEIFDNQHNSLFKYGFKVEPGENLTILPKEKYNKSCDEPGNLIKIYPENNYEADVTFLWCDFVKGDPIISKKPADKVKCVVWDLDNTLWDGILIEHNHNTPLKLKDGVIELIKGLDERGIIQSIASKNDFEPAAEMLKRLGVDKYFLYPQIHWNPKSDSIKQIAKALNIGTDTFAFIDDSPFERKQVEAALPQVRVFSDTDVLDLLSKPCFDVVVTSDSKNRRMMYKAEEKRNRIKNDENTNIEDFIRQCEIKVNLFKPHTDEELLRCYELVLRTNQLNISGIKYSEEEFKDVLSRENAETFAFSCGDVFGEYGIVGFIQYAVENNCIRFTEFAMSCRVAGKFIESALFVHLLEKESVDKGIFNVRVTEKNSLLRRTLEGIGFINSGSDNRVINYVFNKSLKNSNLVKIEER